MIPFLDGLAPRWVKECPAWSRGYRPHVLVSTHAAIAYVKYTLGRDCILEVRGDGHQSVVPPGIHQSGEDYRWIREPGVLKTVTAEELMEWVENSVVAFALSLGWGQGSRHDVALAAAGWMARRSIPVERAVRIIECVAASDGREIHDRRAAVADTYQAVVAGEHATGWPTLERILPPESSGLLRKVWRDSVDDGEERAGPYVARGGKVFRHSVHGEKDSETLLANFDARIEREVKRDDGSAIVPTMLEIGIGSGGQAHAVVAVPATEFAAMHWVIPAFGTNAILSAGFGTKDRVREAIQRFSGQPPSSTVFTHTGWREVKGVWHYLHAGLTGDVEVDLEGALSRYQLPAPGPDPGEGIRRSLALLELGDSPVVTALWCASYLAPLASILKPDFSVWLWGPTGSFKSTLAALFLSHFGDFDRKRLPADWSTTDNALERLAFLAKDVLLVIDEFAPPSARGEMQKLQTKAARILRAQGNLSGRGRLRADTSSRGAMPPRGLVVATAELPPPLPPSAVARTLCIEMTNGAINTELLQEAQNSTGELSVAMAAYIAWLAPRYRDLAATLPEAFESVRAAQTASGHRRIPEVLANLELAATVALTAFKDAEGVSAGQRAELIERIKGDLFLLGAGQDIAVSGGNPGRRFLEVLGELFAKKAIICYSCHSRLGNAPPSCEELGWAAGEVPDSKTGGEVSLHPVPSALRVGWADKEWVYLLPQDSFRHVSRFLGESDQVLGATEPQLHRALEEMGAIEVRKQGNETRRTVLVTLDGTQRRVLKVRRPLLTGGGAL